MEGKDDVVEYDMRATLETLIDEHIPQPSTPEKILRSYLVETLSQPGGRDMISTLVSPVLGLTVGTALVQHRRHRWIGTLNAPFSLVNWLHEQGVDMHQPDRRGNTAFFQVLLFDIQQGTSAYLDNVYNEKSLQETFRGPGFDALRVSPSGQSLLQCPGQNFVGRVLGVKEVQAAVTAALSQVPEATDRWRHMMAMEAGGVAPAQREWWREVRRECQNALLEADLPTAAPQARSRF